MSIIYGPNDPNAPDDPRCRWCDEVMVQATTLFSEWYCPHCDPLDCSACHKPMRWVEGEWVKHEGKKWYRDAHFECANPCCSENPNVEMEE